MAGPIRTTYAAIAVATGLALLAAASPAEAQRRQPRQGVAASPPAEPRQTDPRFPSGYPIADPRLPPGTYSLDDPRARQGRRDGDDRHRNQRSQGPTVIYVPVPGSYGYGYYGGYGTYGSYGGVTDANGRPLTSSYEPPPPAGGYGYTPDLGGSPYAVTDEGMMVVSFSTGERRAFPSCAMLDAERDPQGRPRTIFYRSPDYWMTLRPGQRGRVHGEPPAGAKACYAIDTVGRVVLRY